MGMTEGGPDGRRWVVLGVGVGAMAAGCLFQFGLPFLLPALRAGGLSLAQAGTLVACPMAGLMVALVAWGAAADRWGERLVLSLGLGIAGLALLGAAATAGRLLAMGACLVAAGVSGAAVHAASGRLILGWFGPRERGLAMGIRQTAQPLGVGAAALILPPLAAGGLRAPLLVLAACCLAMAAAVALLVQDPPRAEDEQAGRSRSPYATPVLWRLHAASALLVVPQFTVATFALVFLVDEHGWQATAAGRVLAVVQVAGALGRIGAGVWSDRAGSRLRPYRLVALAITAVMAALAAGAHAGSAAAAAALLVAGVITVTPNGLAYTAVAEYAGRAWAGRALGVQNTAQNALATLTPPLAAAVIGGPGYAMAFAVAGVFSLAAVPLVPVRSEGGTKTGRYIHGSRSSQQVVSGS
ncbi:major facilitator superfamily MFS_1 [Thermomonospora curvata DSM 43183]|uniref:Major facilitator superfamily MFS_1 n=2 Tax=Thermomonosporaceae TaxID=2012 RepID=D1A9X8_THECD|nr:major facilitator superfamily MFS_1 [Thermomonospora curvata DSM 43183]PKK15194.1 MAG: MFS transporter [Thermomonospora sp. CIF 1]